MDSYKNLSFKTLSTFLWQAELENKGLVTEYIIKTDDDINVDWEAFLESLIEDEPHQSTQEILYCHIVLHNRLPTRRKHRHDHKL